MIRNPAEESFMGGIRTTGLVCGLLIGSSALAVPIGTTFAYQGLLKNNGQPATGLYDLQVCVFDDPATPVPLACAPDFDDVPVEDGIFTVPLNFGSGPFAGELRFLEVRVRPGAGGAMLRFRVGALLAAQLGLRPARLGAFGGALLGAELGAGLVRPPRPRKPAALLPRQLVLRILLRLL